MSAPNIKQAVTLADFQKLPESLAPIELINGELIMSPAPKDSHQALITKLIRLLFTAQLEGEFRLAPSDLYLDESNVLQPDLFWVSETNTKCQVREDDYWHGSPDLVVEILSPSTTLRDRREKYHLYEQASVAEYWIVDPQGRSIEVYQLEEGRYQRAGIYGKDDGLISPILGKTFSLKTVF